MRYLILFMSVVILNGCKLPGRRGYVVTNYSRDTVCLYFATGFYLMGPTAYPDTFLPSDRQLQEEGWPYPKKLSEEIMDSWVGPNSKKMLYERLLWKDDKHGEILPRDTLSVFFISKDTLRKYGYDDVRANNRILVRYDLSIHEAQMTDFSFTYPPTEVMRNMKMSPPFSWFEKNNP